MQKKQDKLKSREENSKTLVAVYDIQAVMQLRRGRGVFFYKRKLNVFNFTIYNLTSKQGYATCGMKGLQKEEPVKLHLLCMILKRKVQRKTCNILL